MLLLKRATSFSDCFMPSWCVACDCFPAFHSLKFALVYPYGVSYACPACRLHMLYHFTLGDLPKCVRENETKVVAFNQKRVDRQRILDSQNQWVEIDLKSQLVNFLNSWHTYRKPSPGILLTFCSHMTKWTFRLILSNKWLLKVKTWVHKLESSG